MSHINELSIKISHCLKLARHLILLLLTISLSCIFFKSIALSAEKNIYRSDIHKYSIIFPEGWETRSGRMKNTDVVAVSPKGANIAIVIRSAPDRLIKSFEELPDEELMLLINNIFAQVKIKHTDARLLDC